MMTDDEIKERVRHIRSIKDDDEPAHAFEDELYLEFVKGLAERKDAIGRKARLVLKTRKLDFARWCG